MMKEIIKSDHFAFPKCSFFSKIMRISLICFLFSTLSAVAGTSATQQSAKNSITITGTVIDDLGDALPGVNVIVKGIKSSTITDNYGNFTVKVPYAEASLIFSYVGFQPQEIELEGRTEINITLVEDRKALEEVVVVGYSTQKKATIVGSVSTITTRDLQQSPTANINNALAGRMPGLMINQFSGGEPGVDRADINIRGFATYGDKSPIVIVDGVEREMSYLAAEEIETFTILKDASATAAYGVRGANGVIIVSTKRGKAQEKATVNFKSSVGTNSPVKFPEYLGSADYAALWNEAKRNDNPAKTDDELGLFTQTAIDNFRNAKGDNTDGLGYNWDYFDYAFQPGLQKDYSLSIRGGSDKARYYIMANYFDQTGNYTHTDLADYDTQAIFKRYNFRANMDVDITKDFYAKLDISARITDRNAPGTTANRVVQICNTQAPYLPIILENNEDPANVNFIKENPKGMLYGDQINRYNLLGELSRTGYLNEKNTYMNGTFALGHKLDFITKGLKAEVSFSYDASEGRWINRRVDTYSVGYRTYPSYATFTPVATAGGANTFMEPGHYAGAFVTGNKYEIDQTPGKGFNHNDAISKSYYQMKLDYARTFGDHDVSAMLLANRSGYSRNEDLEIRYQGISARVTYDYAHRYLAEFNMGYNGSENFAKGKRYGFFPAGAIGWVISEEPFMEGTKYWLNNLKVRSSYGMVGSDKNRAPRFSYLQFYNIGGGYSVNNVNFGNGLAEGVQEGDLANPNISWEKSKKFNLGIDGSMFKDRFTVGIDFFKEHRYDIFTDLSSGGKLAFPDIVGAKAPIINSGIVDNHGVDLEIGWRGKIGKNLRFSIRPNLTFARNKIIFQNEVERENAWNRQTGHRIGEHYVYQFDHFVANQEEADALNTSEYQPFGTLSPGDCVYKDLNDDQKIDANGDLTAMGNPRTPEIQFGLPISLQYKGLDLSFLFQGATNGSLLLNGPAVWDFPLIEQDMQGRVKNMHLNRWTPETAATATYPALHLENNVNNKNESNSLFLYDASYVRLKNVEIGYSLPRSAIRFAGFQNVRFYLQGLNLLTFDGLDDVDIDPETGDGNGSWYPVQRVINFGVDINY